MSHIKIIFGLKVKQLRQERNLSFAELALGTGMSISYLNEIEKGKKYPKEDKIELLARALGTTAPELVSPRLTKQLATARLPTFLSLYWYQYHTLRGVSR